MTARLFKTLVLSMTLMGLGMCSGVALPVDAAECSVSCSCHCEDATPCDQQHDSHDGECPPSQHHHHHDGCVHSAASAWFVEGNILSLPHCSFEQEGLDGSDELAPDGPVYVLDKPPLI